MKRYLSIIVALVCLGLFPAQAQVAQTHAGKATPGGGAPPSFNGLGDLSIAGVWGYWSCGRAYSAAYAAGTANLCDIVDTASGASSCTMKANSTTGLADMSSALCVGNTVSVTTFCTVTHAAGCSVTKMYEQTGQTNCTAACSAVQATLANMPTLTLSCQNSLPCPTFAAASSQAFSFTIAAGTPITWPYSIPAVINLNTSFSNGATIFGDAAFAEIQLWGSTTGPSIELNSGSTSVGTPITTNAAHSVQFISNGASTVINIDGTNNALGSPGSQNVSGSVSIGAISGGNFWNGKIMEFAVWSNTTFTTGNRTSVCGNQTGSTNGWNITASC